MKSAINSMRSNNKDSQIVSSKVLPALRGVFFVCSRHVETVVLMSRVKERVYEKSNTFHIEERDLYGSKEK